MAFRRITLGTDLIPIQYMFRAPHISWTPNIPDFPDVELSLAPASLFERYGMIQLAGSELHPAYLPGDRLSA